MCLGPPDHGDLLTAKGKPMSLEPLDPDDYWINEIDDRPRCRNCGVDLSDYDEGVQEWGFCGSECERDHEEGLK